ncbi:MAG: glycosyltransferase [Eubacteriales bacterium]|nr:glycosyltransferase [Eubacteriales bacterium]
MNIDEISLDVIIPSYRPGVKFLKLVNGLGKQDHPVNKLIIMNTDEREMSREILDELNRLNEEKSSSLFGKIELHHISKAEFDHAFTRAKGVEYSKAEAFLCMTDDAVPCDERLISELLESLYGDEKIAEAYGRQLPLEDTDYAERFTRDFNYPDTSFIKSESDIEKYGIKTYFASNVCCMYKRDIYDSLGGFSGPAIFNEDMVYAAAVIKNGYKIAYCAEARVLHAHSYTAKQQLKRNFDLGVSQAMHREIFDEVPSEGEGIRLVISTMKYLIGIRKYYLIPKLVIQSGSKFIGYRLGKAYERLPDWMIMKLAMNTSFAKSRLLKSREDKKL